MMIFPLSCLQKCIGKVEEKLQSSSIAVIFDNIFFKMSMVNGHTFEKTFLKIVTLCHIEH